MNPTPFRTATQLAAAVRDRQIGCVELLDLYLERVAAHNPALNAIIVLDADRARERARQADAALAAGELWGPLHGVPMTLKESFDVEGLATTFGDPTYRDNIARSHSLVAQRMLDAGVTLFGKTNVPLNLADWQSYNEIYGTTNNPWDLARTPGGSSGGSAAALAAGLTGLDAGSDIGSSIRNPASYCGIFGHKPTWGVVSPQGHNLPGSTAAADIGVVGPLARGADDLEVALLAMAGPDAIDGRGWTLTLPPATKRELGEFKVGLLLDDPNARVDRSVQDQLQALGDFLGQRGAKVDDAARPAFDTAELNDVFVRLLRAATSGRLDDDAWAMAAVEAQRFAPADRRYYAQAMRGNSLSHRDWLVLDERRHELRRAWDAFFADYDLMLCPATMSTAFPHDQAGDRNERTIRIDDADVLVTDQIFWAGYTGVAYLPSTVAPLGLSDEGLPVGVQIVGPQYGDLTCIHFARLLERDYRAFRAPPRFSGA